MLHELQHMEKLKTAGNIYAVREGMERGPNVETVFCDLTSDEKSGMETVF